jgi:D-3-phosphoglycerate dehydrogenase
LEIQAADIPVHSATLRIGLSRDFLTSTNELAFDAVAWERLKLLPGARVEFLASPPAAALTPEDVARFDVLIIKRNPLSATTLQTPGLRLRLLLRNGVGVDHIDVSACTQAGVMVCTTPDAVARPVASAAMALLLAFSHELFTRDRLTRAGRWSERWNRAGVALTGRTLGVVGLGNIGNELLRLAAPWGMRHLGHTPHFDIDRHGALRVEPVGLDQLLAESDFVVLCCPLNDQTRGMIDAHRFALMRPHAYLINVARGGIVNEAALVQALQDRRIAGAGIDVYETEPPAPDHPLLALDNVVLGSHNLAFTDALNRDANLISAEAVWQFYAGRRPRHVLNPVVLEHARWEAYARAFLI